jgi:hypothetical protein
MVVVSGRNHVVSICGRAMPGSGRVEEPLSDLGYALCSLFATDFPLVVSQYLILVQLMYSTLSEPDVRR